MCDNFPRASCILIAEAIYFSSPNVTFIDLSSAVCKFKAHKRCAVRSTNNCKWTTLASIGNDIIEDEEGVSDYGCETTKSMLRLWKASV